MISSTPNSLWPCRTTLLTFIGLTLFAIAAWLAWYMQGLVVPWDSKNHFYAMYRFLGGAMARGEVPLWNPYHFGGYPAISDPQSLIFTPTMFLAALILPSASMLQFDGLIFSHLLLGGYGILGLFRRRQWHPLGAILAGMIFILGGSAAARLQHTGMIISYSFIPLSLFFLEEMLEKRCFWYGFAFAVCAALMALGRDQVAFLGCLLLIGSVIWYCATHMHPLKFLKERLPHFIFVCLVAGAILFVPCLLTLQFLASSNRPGISFGVALTGSLAPVNFVTFFVPNIFGSLNWSYDYWGPGYDTMTSPDWTDRAIDYLFIGTLPALLLLWQGIARLRFRDFACRFFVFASLFALLYALGRSTYFFNIFFDLFPGVELYRRPADATFLLNICLALLSGYLLHCYILEPRAITSLPINTRRILALLACATPLCLVAAALSLSFAAGKLWPSLHAVSLALLMGFTGWLLCRILPRFMAPYWVACLIVFATGVELIARNAASSLNAEPISAYAVYAKLPESQAQGLALLQKELTQRVEKGEHPRVEILGLNGPWQNASMALGFEDTLGYNPLRIADYERAIGPGQNAGDPNLRRYPDTFRGYQSPLASMLGIEYLIIDRPLNRMPRHVPRPFATQVYTGDHFYIYRLPKGAPRAYFATNALCVNREEVFTQGQLPEFDKTREVLIDVDQCTNLKLPQQQETLPNSVKIVAYHNSKVVLKVSAQQQGVVVLHDLFYPGWSVSVDGVQKPILRTNILFRGVEIGPGQHEVIFKFRPLALDNLLATFTYLTHAWSGQ